MLMIAWQAQVDEGTMVYDTEDEDDVVRRGIGIDYVSGARVQSKASSIHVLTVLLRH